MKTVKVKFNSMLDCQKFVMAVENYPFHIDLQWGRQVVDAKSILGILGFGLYKVLELKMHTDDEASKAEFIEKINFCVCPDEMKVAI